MVSDTIFGSEGNPAILKLPRHSKGLGQPVELAELDARALVRWVLGGAL